MSSVESYSLGVVYSALLNSGQRWIGIASKQLRWFTYHARRRNLWLHFYFTDTSTKCAKRFLIHFERTDTWRYQPFKNNIACFSFIKSPTSFTSKVSTLKVNVEGIRQQKTHTRFNLCTCYWYAQGKKINRSPSTFPLTNCWFRF